MAQDISLDDSDNRQCSTDAVETITHSSIEYSNPPHQPAVSSREICASVAKESINPSSSHSFSNDSSYVIENPFADNELANSASQADDATRKILDDQKTKPHLVSINIPCDDSGVPTIAKNHSKSDSSLVIENPLLITTTQNPQDDKCSQNHIPTTLETHLRTTSEETNKLHPLSNDTNCVIENLNTDSTPCPGVSNADGVLKLPISQNVIPRSSYMVAISIPDDDSSIPTLAESKVTHDQSTTASCGETIRLQENPAYAAIGDKCTTATASSDETVEKQRNPAHVSNGDACTTVSSDETVELQRNPAYSTMSHTTSDVHLYEVISYDYCTITSTATTNNTVNTSTIKMQENPAYATMDHA